MVRWTSDVDQILFLSILETHNISINYEAVLEAWPKDMEQPTKKAISERILKLRKQVKEAADIRAASHNGSSSATNTPNSKIGNVTRTPASGRGGKSGQRRSAPGSAQGTPSRPAKRARNKETAGSSDHEPSSYDSGNGKSNAKEQNALGAMVKEEHFESQFAHLDETPTFELHPEI